MPKRRLILQNQTDLKQVKRVSKILLFTEIHNTDLRSLKVLQRLQLKQTAKQRSKCRSTSRLLHIGLRAEIVGT